MNACPQDCKVVYRSASEVHYAPDKPMFGWFVGVVRKPAHRALYKPLPLSQRDRQVLAVLRSLGGEATSREWKQASCSAGVPRRTHSWCKRRLLARGIVRRVGRLYWVDE